MTLDPGTWGILLPVVMTVAGVWLAFCLLPPGAADGSFVRRRRFWLPLAILIIVGGLYLYHHATLTVDVAWY